MEKREIYEGKKSEQPRKRMRLMTEKARGETEEDGQQEMLKHGSSQQKMEQVVEKEVKQQ